MGEEKDFESFLNFITVNSKDPVGRTIDASWFDEMQWWESAQRAYQIKQNYGWVKPIGEPLL